MGLRISQEMTGRVNALTADKQARAAPRPPPAMRALPVLMRSLASHIAKAAPPAALQEEERRQRALAPYLVGAPKRGIIGQSKYANRLRQQVCVYVCLGGWGEG